jgi:hypothetical protein
MIADIDGDGKDDILTIHPDGSLTALRNGGVGIPTYWQDLGVVFKEGGDRAWTNYKLVRIRPVYFFCAALAYQIIAWIRHHSDILPDRYQRGW